jgi:hypothetical protein
VNEPAKPLSFPFAARCATHGQSTSQEAFSVRRIIWLTLSRPEELTPEHTQELAQMFSFSATVATALMQAQAFVKLLREKQVA